MLYDVRSIIDEPYKFHVICWNMVYFSLQILLIIWFSDLHLLLINSIQRPEMKRVKQSFIYRDGLDMMVRTNGVTKSGSLFYKIASSNWTCYKLNTTLNRIKILMHDDASTKKVSVQNRSQNRKGSNLIDPCFEKTIEKTIVVPFAQEASLFRKKLNIVYDLKSLIYIHTSIISHTKNFLTG